MKRIFAILLVLMIMVTPIVASAAEVTVPEEVVEGDNSTIVEEVPTEGEISEETNEEEAPTATEVVQTVTESITIWIEEHSVELGIIFTLIGYGIVLFKKLGTVIKSAGTMNNNTIKVAKNSEDFIGQAMLKMEEASSVVSSYGEKMALLLDAFHNTAEDKARLEKELLEMHKALKLAKDANVEFANELAELLALANIPNYKKEEIGARHLAAVNAIAEAEKEEVKEVVGEEA